MVPSVDKVKTGNRIRSLMHMNNISAKDIMEYLSLECVQSVYHWLDGRSLPTIDNLYALSILFRVPLESLVDPSGDIYRSIRKIQTMRRWGNNKKTGTYLKEAIIHTGNFTTGADDKSTDVREGEDAQEQYRGDRSEIILETNPLFSEGFGLLAQGGRIMQYSLKYNSNSSFLL